MSAASVSFTEEMKGYVTLGEADFEQGAKQGKHDKNFFMFHLTITADDVDRFVADPQHVAGAVGWVECETLGGKLPVEKGVFNLFVDVEPGFKKMLYRLFFADGAGHPLTMSGYKLVKDDPGMDLWPDTSTLYTRVLAGHVEADAEPAAEIVASGVIHIWVRDFLRQLTTFRAHGGDGTGDRLRALEKFGSLFLGDLWEVYGPFARKAAAEG